MMKSRFPVCYYSAILGASVYIAVAILAYVRYFVSFSPTHNWLSDLGNQIDNPHGAILYNTGVITSAVCLAIWFTAGLSQWKLKHKVVQHRLLLISQIAGLLAAFATTMSAIYPINIFQIHAFWSKVHFMMSCMVFGFSVSALRYHPLLPQANLYVGATTAVLPTLMLIFGNSYWFEWATVGCMIVYMLLIGKASLTFSRSRNSSIPGKSSIDLRRDPL
ncbi:MAG TPA: hypothetical protein VK249_10740 [Anaerolineales bacterium]|nr:hypothetical protein [Anaerolineales bacterium]